MLIRKKSLKINIFDAEKNLEEKSKRAFVTLKDTTRLLLFFMFSWWIINRFLKNV